ncbi:hypothetical protein J5W49_00920 [Candidatus Akkermansia timonensis]|jgi:hypothetical protein|nr:MULTISPECIES: hypothetical protein [Akkermansia]MBT9599824.1 hypothetical protein [Akkermansia muciniphila]HJH95856.1 hypothetical protein [Akkermansiaceae bacterium]MBS7153099.1 hypothetical protein [Akkermansia sp.]MBT9561564.1 hypothetical protein [Candidatus Akkermansia timonensis]QWO86273.1 hypothetical protein J5W67_00900 [Candidatus Akkermansia timonensis]
MEKCQDNGEHIIVKKKRRSDKMNTMIIILSLLCIDSIKDKGVSNKMGKYMNTVENSQHDKIVKSLSIFIKCNLDNRLSVNIQEIITLRDFLKDKNLETFDWKSILPPLN